MEFSHVWLLVCPPRTKRLRGPTCPSKPSCGTVYLIVSTFLKAPVSTNIGSDWSSGFLRSPKETS